MELRLLAARSLSGRRALVGLRRRDSLDCLDRLGLGVGLACGLLDLFDDRLNCSTIVCPARSQLAVVLEAVATQDELASLIIDRDVTMVNDILPGCLRRNVAKLDTAAARQELLDEGGDT